MKVVILPLFEVWGCVCGNWWIRYYNWRGCGCRGGRRRIWINIARTNERVDTSGRKIECWVTVVGSTRIFDFKSYGARSCTIKFIRSAILDALLEMKGPCAEEWGRIVRSIKVVISSRIAYNDRSLPQRSCNVFLTQIPVDSIGYHVWVICYCVGSIEGFCCRISGWNQILRVIFESQHMNFSWLKLPAVN